MSIKLQLRRGLEVNLPSLAEGEPGFCTDTYKLFIGSAAGNKGIAMLAGLLSIGDIVGPAGILVGDKWGNIGIGDATTLGKLSGWLPSNNVVIGRGSAPELVTGSHNVVIGSSAALLLTNSYNTLVGGNIATNLTTAQRVTALGYCAAHRNATGSSGVYLGYDSGNYETGDFKLFIDSISRASEADGRIKALIYGIFDALTANQRLSINARLLVRECPNYANNTAALAGGLVSGELYTVTGTDPLQVAKVI